MQKKVNQMKRTIINDQNLFFLTSIPFIHRLAMMESSPQTIMWNSRESERRGLNS